MKNQKGITLVALVITIIVLLILAGVTISLVAGDTGILGRATGAVETNEKATVKQEVQLGAADAMLAYYEEVAKNTSPAPEKVDFLKTKSYYENNCVSAEEITSVTENSGVITVKYKTKSNITYDVTFNVATPNELTVTPAS